MDRLRVEQEISKAVVEISAILNSGPTTIWVGAGISRHALNANGEPYPDIESLIPKLCAACGVDHTGDIQTANYSHIAEECKKRDLPAYHRVLGQEFGGVPVSIPSAAFYILALARRFLITTNYDRIFIEAGAKQRNDLRYIKYPDLSPYPDEDPPIVVYLHGLAPLSNLEPAENLVLATSEFEEAYKQPTGANQDEGPAYYYLRGILPYWSLLIIAYSMSDPEIHDVFRELGKLRDSLFKQRSKSSSCTKPEWVLVIGETPNKEELIGRAQDAGVEKQIVYPSATEEHVELVEILSRLSKLTPTPRSEIGDMDRVSKGDVMPGE
jgi:hypothetical protein